MDAAGDNVLLLVSEQTDRLYDRLIALGFHPTVVNGMNSALERLRHDSPVAVFVDHDHLQDDVLEFVLNARDVDESVPILVVSHLTDDRGIRVLSKKENIEIIPDTEEHLRSKVEYLFR